MLIRCQHCNRILGELQLGYAIVRWRGREVTGAITSIRCDECGEVWTPDSRKCTRNGQVLALDEETNASRAVSR